MSSLEGKVALISGGARGIGAETARLMVAAGAKVVIGDILDDAGRAAAAQIAGGTGAIIYTRLDVTNAESWISAVDLAGSTFGGLDVLVNNAAFYLGRDFEEATVDDWHKLVAVNMTGVYFGTKFAAPALRIASKRARHGSSIVNISSIAGLVGSVVDPLYSMTKGGVTLFTKATALSFAKKGDRIRVNSVHPGIIETDMGNQTIGARGALLGINDPDAAKVAASGVHPVGRLGTAGDVAKTVVFLASDDAGFMTGSSLVVDGGYTAQ